MTFQTLGLDVDPPTRTLTSSHQMVSVKRAMYMSFLAMVDKNALLPDIICSVEPMDT